MITINHDHLREWTSASRSISGLVGQKVGAVCHMPSFKSSLSLALYAEDSFKKALRARQGTHVFEHTYTRLPLHSQWLSETLSSFYNHSQHLQSPLQKTQKKWTNKVIIFVFFAHKKYSRNFIKLRLNHWCHIDCFTDVFTMFLDLGTFQLGCCLWRVK